VTILAKKTIKKNKTLLQRIKIPNSVYTIIDMCIIFLCLWLIINVANSIWAVLGIVLCYGLYKIWRGWEQMKFLFVMADGVVDKYKYVRKVKRNGKLKNK
jgi:hypothetical protein